MLTFVGYTLAFILIGLFAGLVARRYMPGGGASHYRGHFAAGVLGALAGGVGWLLVVWFAWSRQRAFPEGDAYERLDPGQSQLPGYWIGLFTAGAVSLLALAAYKLMVGRSRRA